MAAPQGGCPARTVPAVSRALDAIEGGLGADVSVAIRPVPGSSAGAHELSASAPGRSVRAWGGRTWAVVALRAEGEDTERVYPNAHTARHQLGLKPRARPRTAQAHAHAQT